MTNDNPPPTPGLTLSDKLMAINHLTTFVPQKLDVDAMNHSSWVYYFSYLCHGYGILDHLVDPVASSSTMTSTDPPPKDAKWTKIDFIIRYWIFSTLAPSLRKCLVDLNPTTTKDAWTYIEAISRDNKCPQSIVPVLNGLGSPLSNDNVVTFALEGLPSTYETISIVIVSRESFPDLKTGSVPTGSPQQWGPLSPAWGFSQTLSGPSQGVHLVPGTLQPPIQFTTGQQVATTTAAAVATTAGSSSTTTAIAVATSVTHHRSSSSHRVATKQSTTETPIPRHKEQQPTAATSRHHHTPGQPRSESDVIHGSSSSDVALSVGLTMACVAPRSHGGDAGGDPPRQPTGPIPAQCQGTFHPLGVNASYLNSLMGEQIRPLPLACEWEEIPPAYKAHILPTLESYFNLTKWYNRQDKVVVDDNVYTVGERVRLGLELKLRLLWRKRKTRIKAEHFKIHETPDDAKAHMPPPKVWDDRTQEDWEELVDWWSHPDRVARSVQNAANQAKNTIMSEPFVLFHIDAIFIPLVWTFCQSLLRTTRSMKIFLASFLVFDQYNIYNSSEDGQGATGEEAEIWPCLWELPLTGYYEDLRETWRIRANSKKNGQFKTKKTRRDNEMKAMKDHIRSGIIPFKMDQEILDEIIPSDQPEEYVDRAQEVTTGWWLNFSQVIKSSMLEILCLEQSRSCIEYRKQLRRRKHGLGCCAKKDLARDYNNESSSGEEEVEESGGDYSDED
ncbi:hypothetical protein Tco_0483391 [Tanacetum coccineum]